MFCSFSSSLTFRLFDSSPFPIDDCCNPMPPCPPFFFSFLPSLIVSISVAVVFSVFSGGWSACGFVPGQAIVGAFFFYFVRFFVVLYR